MSGLRSVAAMWVGNEYPSDKSTVMGGRGRQVVLDDVGHCL